MDQLLLTKLNAPPLRPGLVQRPGLTGRLNRGKALGCRLTLISAPAGYGKTTLVCEWFATLAVADAVTGEARTVTWLALDSGDNDPARCFAYLVAALRKFDPTLGQATLDYLSAPRLPSAATLVTPLINDIALTPGSVTLVLDDLHTVSNLLIHDALDFLIQHAPPNLHVVILTREDPPLSLATLRGRGQLAEIRLNDLRFSGDEARAFFRATMGLELEPEVVDSLGVRTEGWVAGLQLAALSVQGCAAEDLADFLVAFSGSDRYVMDYLVDQVLCRLPEEVRSFMVATSVLDRICGPLCDALTADKAGRGRNNGKAMLQQLDAANLFLVRLDSHGEWFRFHHLFAELLRLELEEGQRVELHRRAAAWFEENGLLSEAIHHALAGRDFDRAAHLVARISADLLRTSELRTLLGWIDRLPPDLVQQDAELVVHRAAALFFTGDAHKAFRCLDEIEGSASFSTLEPRIHGRLLALRAWEANLANAMAEVRSVAMRALQLMCADEVFYRMVALLPLGHAQSAAGETRDAEQTYRETVRMGREAGHALATIAGLVDLAFNLLEQGRLRDAVGLCHDTLRRQVDRRGAPLPLARLMYLPLATTCYQGNRLEEAQENAARGLEASEQMLSDAVMGGDGEMILATSDFALGRPEAALARCEEARQRAEQLGYERVAQGFEALEAELRLRRGEVAGAARWAERCQDAFAGPLLPAREMEYRVYVRYLLADGRPQEALRLLDEMERAARSAGRNSRLIIALIWKAIATEALLREDAAVSALAEAVQLAAPEDLRRVFLDTDQQVLAGLLPKVREFAPAFVDSLLDGVLLGHSVHGSAHCSGTGAAVISGTDANHMLPEPLTTRELEVLRLLAGGLSYRQIASQLIVAQGTVQAHCGSIYGKLGVNNRTQALAQARELHLL